MKRNLLVVGLQAEGGAFVRHSPEEGFGCEDGGVAVLEGDCTTTG